jgi:hypothetical protein
MAFTVEWHTDYDSSWLSADFTSGESRVRIPTNRRGHWFQWEIEGDGQNQRIELKNAMLTVRLHGPSYGANQS